MQNVTLERAKIASPQIAARPVRLILPFPTVPPFAEGPHSDRQHSGCVLWNHPQAAAAAVPRSPGARSRGRRGLPASFLSKAVSPQLSEVTSGNG